MEPSTCIRASKCQLLIDSMLVIGKVREILGYVEFGCPPEQVIDQIRNIVEVRKNELQM